MEESLAENEIRDHPAAAAAGGAIGGGGVSGGPLRQLTELGIVVLRRIQQAAAVFFLFWGRLGGLDALLQLIEPAEDRRLQAAAFFFTFGCCTVLDGTAMNRSANPEHLLAGFVLLTLGAAIAILTLAGGRAGRAAAEMERFLRGFFF